MQRPYGRRTAAAVTALLVALSGAVVVLSAPPAAARSREPVKATATATARATAQRTVRATMHGRARVTAKAVSRARAKGKPVGHARVTRRARTVASARATVRVTVRAKARATATAATHQRAERRAEEKARRKAKRKARAHARAEASSQARVKARHRAQAKARKRAHARAIHRARKRAHHLARLRRIDPKDPTTWIRYAPRKVTPRPGARFNNPYAGFDKRRALLAQVIRSVKSAPGYKLTKDPDTGRRLRCPTKRKHYPSEIKIAVYSIADKRFGKAVAAADRRCVSVQVLMNSHLTSVTSHSWRQIVDTLGTRSRKHWRKQRSFAHRCSNGCLGTSVLHSKFYLFSRAGRAHHTVITGSSNMTRNAVGIQWNDLYTVNNRKRLYRQYRTMFNKMVRDRKANGPFVYRDGRYTSTFYPFRKATRKTDRTLRSLRTISCRGARDGTGIRGRTVLYIAMHAWFSQRGKWLARQVRRMYSQGCYIRILYSFMSEPIFKKLTHRAGHRMVVRRVLFPGRLGLRASKYSHMKLYAASGVVRGDRSARVVWTGSNNWVLKSLHADEVTLRIKSAKAYRSYVRHWQFMKRLRSSPTWAKFQEPEGGGRAP